MTELKTLKDLDKFTLESDNYPGGAGGYLQSVDKWNKEEDNDEEDILFKKSDLRQEAIKWVKQHRKITPRWAKETNEEFFMAFFDITEEDLK